LLTTLLSLAVVAVVLLSQGKDMLVLVLEQAVIVNSLLKTLLSVLHLQSP
jgi:hypothetical protein